MAPKTCNNTFFTSNSIIVKLHFSPPYPRKIIIRHFSVPPGLRGRGFAIINFFAGAVTHKYLYRFFYTVSFNLFYTEKILGTYFIARMCFYALRLTRARDHTRAFTHKYIQKLLRAKSCTTPPKKYTSACTHQNCLQVFLHARTFMRKRFHMVFCT